MKRRAPLLAAPLAAIFVTLLISHAWAGTVTRERLLDVVQSHTTEIDIDGDRKPDVLRKFDLDGDLKEMTWIDSSTTPPTVETYKVTEGGLKRTTDVVRGELALKQVTELRRHDQSLVERVTLTSSRDDGKLDLRRVERPENNGIRITTFADDKPTGDKLVPRFLFDTSSCTAPSAPGFSGLTAAAGPPTKPTEKLLPSGYRIDLTSCKNPASQKAIEKATELVMSQFLGCVTKANAKVGAKFASVLAKQHLRIRCAGQGTVAVYKDLCKNLSDKDRVACLNAAPKETNGAFYDPGFPDDIILTQNDPGVSTTTATVPGALADSIAHETLHALDMPTSDLAMDVHNSGHLADDSVYGCEQICTMYPGDDAIKFITQENCTGCRTEFGNETPGLAAKACMRYLPEKAMVPARRARLIGFHLNKCIDKHIASACTAVGLSEDFEVCKALNLTVDKPQCQKALKERAYSLLRQAETAPGFRPEQTWWFNWNEFKYSLEPK